MYWVYVVSPENGWPCKVGYGKNLVTRLGQLQVGCWERLRIQRKFWVSDKSAAIKMERFCHKKLDEVCDRITGEWFNFFVDDVIKVMEDAFSYQKLCGALKEKENWGEEKVSFYGYIEG